MPINMCFLCCPAVVHGQREGRGAVAKQTGLTTTGEAHGKSCDLKDTRNPEDLSCSLDSFNPDLHLNHSVKFAFTESMSAMSVLF